MSWAEQCEITAGAVLHPGLSQGGDTLLCMHSAACCCFHLFKENIGVEERRNQPP